jgi:hypothetical protein
MTLNSDVLSAITAAGQLFAGYGTVTLGPVQFSGMSLPISMPIGGEQLMSVQKLPGGARIIDVMAQDDDDIGWAGYLDGQFATEIAQTLDKIRRSGQAVTLAWDVFSYQVVVCRFSCQIRHTPMPYRICCTVIADNTLVTGTTAVSMALQVTADLQDGNPVAALGAVSQSIVGSTVANAGIAASATNATTVGSAAYAAAVGAVNTAASALQMASSTADATLAPLGVSLQSLTQAATTGLDTLGFSSDVSNALAACGDAANLSAAQGYVIRAQQNLARASA